MEANGASSEAQMPQQARRVVLLGASNLTMGLAIVVGAVRARRQEKINLLVACGHGRSYGKTSRVAFRALPGILHCGLWDALSKENARATDALITDIGNDLLYGVRVDELMKWIDCCVERLTAAGARITITQLPIDNLPDLAPWKFKLLRQLLFPNSTVTLDQIKRDACRLNEWLIELAKSRKIPLISQQKAWYGLDPIHFTRRSRLLAWESILAPWDQAKDDSARQRVQRAHFARSWYLQSRVPLSRTLFGHTQSREQPSVHWRDGSTLSLY